MNGPYKILVVYVDNAGHDIFEVTEHRVADGHLYFRESIEGNEFLTIIAAGRWAAVSEIHDGT